MAIINCHGISKYFGSDRILDSVSFSIDRGSKTALIGKNGSGKTSLLKILTGVDTEFDGSITVEQGARIGYVPQYLEIDDDTTVAGYLLESFLANQEALRVEEERLASARGDELERALVSYQRVRDIYDNERCDEMPGRADMLLLEFGLESLRDHRVATLSGGERNLLALARIVMDEPDVIILDEPGNHLDYAGLERLQQYLSDFSGTVLVVSHNRYLLDRVVDGILELENQAVTSYTGNYSSYRMQKLRAITAQQADYAASRKQLEKLEALVARFARIARAVADPAWGRRLRARRTQLSVAKERAVERPVLDRSSIEPNLTHQKSRADFALKVNGYSRSIAGRALFEDASFVLHTGEHAALIGPNGSGKTTFLRDLYTEGSWDGDVLRIGPSMKLAYCAQNQEVFEGEDSILDAFRKLGALTRHDVHAALRSYLFSYQDLEKKIAELSGGELNRLQIARAQVLGANFLMLDEPTNHLDISAREAIEDALDQYDGTILVVSHDRYFLEKVATKIVALIDGRFETYEGTFGEFRRDYPEFFGLGAPGSAASRPAKPDGKIRRGPGVSENGHDLRLLESRIEEAEETKRKLEAQIAEVFTAGDHIQGKALANKLEKHEKRLERLYEQWAAASG